jgi:hypothetical protein
MYTHDVSDLFVVRAPMLLLVRRAVDARVEGEKLTAECVYVRHQHACTCYLLCDQTKAQVEDIMGMCILRVYECIRIVPYLAVAHKGHVCVALATCLSWSRLGPRHIASRECLPAFAVSGTVSDARRAAAAEERGKARPASAGVGHLPLRRSFLPFHEYVCLYVCVVLIICAYVLMVCASVCTHVPVVCMWMKRTVSAGARKSR